ncbi:putative dehydrogenase/reductase SDR family member 12-like [Sesbania bispinosa]|nr:putative dehydrogenase/reductase SDR family member 12-like [Sesbania bispinosa]
MRCSEMSPLGNGEGALICNNGGCFIDEEEHSDDAIETSAGTNAIETRDAVGALLPEMLLGRCCTRHNQEEHSRGIAASTTS